MNIGSFFSAIGHWFVKQANSLEKLFKKVEPYMEQADKIVTEINTVLGEYEGALDKLPGSQFVPQIQSWLTKYVGVESQVEAFLKANDSVPADVLVRNAAKLALTSSNPNIQVAGKELNFIIEAALSTTSQ